MVIRVPEVGLTVGPSHLFCLLVIICIYSLFIFIQLTQFSMIINTITLIQFFVI